MQSRGCPVISLFMGIFMKKTHFSAGRISASILGPAVPVLVIVATLSHQVLYDALCLNFSASRSSRLSLDGPHLYGLAPI